MTDNGHMEYDDFMWEPDRDRDREGGPPSGQERGQDPDPDPDAEPWRQPFSWEAPQQPETERDPFSDTGPLDPYPPIGGTSQAGGATPGDRDRQRFWRSEPEPPPSLPPDDASSPNGHANGHNGHGGFDDTGAGGRYADFTEALIERLADGVADPHTDPRLPRQPPPPQPPPDPRRDPRDPGQRRDRTGPIGPLPDSDGPPIAARRQPPPPPDASPPPAPPPAPPAPPRSAAPAPPEPAADFRRRPEDQDPGADTGAFHPAAWDDPGGGFGDGAGPESAPPVGSQTGPQATIPSRASRHQGRGRQGVKLPKPSVPRRPGPGSTRGLHRPSAPRPSAPGVRPGVRRRPMAVPLPGELSGMARSSLALVGALVVVAAALVGITSVLPKPRSLAVPPTLDPYSQRWVCPLLTNQKATITVANAGNATATLRTITRVGGGLAALNAKPVPSRLAAGQTSTINETTTNQPGMVQVESFNAPVVVSATGQPACMPGPTDHAWLPIADLSVGANTSLVIANPEGDDAVVDLVPHLANGSLAGMTDEVFVPRRSTVTQQVKNIGNSLGQGLQFSLEAVARSGRVVVGGIISRRSQPETFVPGQSTPRSSWSFAGGLSGNGHNTTLLVSNPSTSPLQVSARVIGDKGAFDLRDPAFDKPVPSGGMAQIPINPPATLSSPGSGGAFGVQVSSRGGARFIAALRVSSPFGSAQQVAYVDPGSALPDRSWLAPGAGGGKAVLVNTSDTTVNAQLIPVGGQAPGAAATRNGGKTATGSGKAAAPPPAATVTLPPGRAVVRAVPAGVVALDVETGEPGVLVALLGSGEAIPSAEVGGVPAEGPVVQGPAAS